MNVKNATLKDNTAKTLVAKSETSAVLEGLSSVFQRADRALADRPDLVVIATNAGYLSAPGWNNGTTIFFNKTLLGSLESDDDMLKITGLNFHELAHIMYTPRQGQWIDTQVRQSSCWRSYNVLEDQRIETFMVGRYRSTRSYFSMIIMKFILNDSSGWDGVFPLLHGRRYLPLAIRQEMRRRFRHQQIVPELASLIDEYRHIVYPRDEHDALRIIQRFDTLLRSVQQRMPNDPFGHGASNRRPEISEGEADPQEDQEDAESYVDYNSDDIHDDAVSEPSDYEEEEAEDDASGADPSESPERGDADSDDDGSGDDQDTGEEDGSAGADDESDSDGDWDAGSDDDGDASDDDGEEGEDDGSSDSGDDGDDESDDLSDDDGELTGDEDDDWESDVDGEDSLDDPDMEDDDDPDGESDQWSDDGDDDDASDDAEEAEEGEDDLDGSDSNGAGAGDSEWEGDDSDDDEPKMTDDELREQLGEQIESITSSSEVREDIRQKERAIEKTTGKMPVLDKKAFREMVVGSDWRSASRKFEKELMRIWADSDPGWEQGQPSGRVNVQRAMRGADLDTVFDRWEEGNQSATDIDMIMLVDHSVSMDDQMETVSQALWAIKRAVESVGGDVTVLGFGDDASVMYNRYEKASNSKYRRFSDEGGTQPQEAFAEAYTMLMHSQAKHRIFLVLTDGAFYNDDPCNDIVDVLNSHGIVTALGFLASDYMHVRLLQKKPEEAYEDTWHHCKATAMFSGASGLVSLAKNVVKEAMKQ